MSLGMLLAVPAIALADQVANNIDGSVDSIAETMALEQGGANGTTKLYIVPQNDDGKNGCNLTGSTTLTISLASSNTSVATVSPSTVTFTSCVDSANGIPVTVTPVGQGSADITASLVSNTTSGTFDLTTAKFTANVSPATPTNTPPNVTVSGVTGGASYNKGSVPAATCQVTDAEDGNSTFAATLSPITGPNADDGIGEQTASCSYTDAGGVTDTDSLTYNIVDPSAPSIGYTLNPASPDGNNGWYKSDVTLTWNVSEPESPNSLQKTGCVDQNITADQAETTYSCSATSAGGSAGPVEVKIKRDGSAPDITDAGAKSAPDGANGWYITEAFNKWTASDSPSGLADTTKASFEVGTGAREGSDLTVESGPVSDNAGNTAASETSAASFDVDLSDPYDVKFVGGPAAGGSYDFGTVPNAPTCTASDDVSGMPASGGCVVTGYSTAAGPHTMTAKATDNAGRTKTETRSYTVAPYNLKGFYQPVDMNDTVNTVKNGSTVPVKFELFQSISGTELTSTSAVTSVLARPMACGDLAGEPEDPIETVTTGGTSLRYDTTGGQFIFNWQTPKGATQVGKCYSLTMTAADNSTIIAYFKLK
jgi:hypothetical protein